MGPSATAACFRKSLGLPTSPRQGTTGRFPNPRYRIPRTLAHAQVVKRYSGKRLVAVETLKAHGSCQRIEPGLEELGYNQPNTSAVERFNPTARRLNADQVRR